VCFADLKNIRSAISNGNLWELVERRASSNPYLLEALNELKRVENKRWLEYFEPISKNKAMFYTGSQTIHRPIVYRSNKRLNERFKPVFKSVVIFKEGNKPYSTFYSDEIGKIFNKKNADMLIKSHIGPVPLELDEMYPFAQSVFPDTVDCETENISNVMFNHYIKNLKTHFWNGNKTLTELEEISDKNLDFDLLRISAVSDMQFGKDASKALLNGDIRVVKSKKTAKIRNIFCNEKHILSMRASDGMFTLKIDGGIVLHKFFKYPSLRVVVDADAAPMFVK